MIRHESQSSSNFKNEDVLESQDAELESSFYGHVPKTSSLWRTIPLKNVEYAAPPRHIHGAIN